MWVSCDREPSHRYVLGRAHTHNRYERSLRPCAARFAAAQDITGATDQPSRNRYGGRRTPCSVMIALMFAAGVTSNAGL